MLTAKQVSADQRARLLMSTERLNKSSDRVRESRKTMLETEELGVSILHDLHQQRQSLLHAHGTVLLSFSINFFIFCLNLHKSDCFLFCLCQLHGVDDNISKSKKILTAMSRRMNRNKWIIGSIVAVLVLAIILILYFKLKN